MNYRTLEDSVRTKLVQQGYEEIVKRLERTAELMPRIAIEGLNRELAEFHNLAGKLPIVDSTDLGALLLEQVGDLTESVQKRIRFYNEAAYRTSWTCNDPDFGTRHHEPYQRLAKKISLLQDLNLTSGSS